VVDLAVVGLWLDFMIFSVFSNLNDSMILQPIIQEGTKPIQDGPIPNYDRNRWQTLGCENTPEKFRNGL